MSQPKSHMERVSEEKRKRERERGGKKSTDARERRKCNEVLEERVTVKPLEFIA